MILIAGILVSPGKSAQIVASADSTVVPPINELIKKRVESAFAAGQYRCQGELICGISTLPAFYAQRNHAPAWIPADGPPVLPHRLLGAIAQAALEGLDPEDYHPEQIARLMKQSENLREKPEKLADLELLCTDAYLMLGSHLLSGRVNPENIHPNWVVADREADIIGSLRHAVETGGIAESLWALTPPDEGYAVLKKTLGSYRQLARLEQDVLIEPGENMELGSSGNRVILLRKRLLQLGDVNASDPLQPHVFDTSLDHAVRRFQSRHGLNADGIVGPLTLSALNVPLQRRVRQIELNMERWRWLPHDLGRRYLLVNIADFSLTGIENGKKTLEMRVVVGRPYRKTPVFSETLKYMVINPYWNVPKSIAVRDILPKVKNNPGYKIFLKVKSQ